MSTTLESRIFFVDTYEYVCIARSQPQGSPLSRVSSGWGFNDNHGNFHGPYATHQQAVNALVRYTNFTAARKDTP